MTRFRLTVLLTCLVLLPASALAQGASLHGFGPINSSMGGAGVALPEDSLNALGFNPALVRRSRAIRSRSRPSSSRTTSRSTPPTGT